MKGILFLSIVLFGAWRGESRGTSAWAVSVRVGENATLDCPLPMSSNHAVVSWYKHSHEERPELILSYPLTNVSLMIYGPGFQPEKFRAQSNRSGRVPQQLLIRGSTENDTAVYYCGLAEVGDKGFPEDTTRPRII